LGALALHGLALLVRARHTLDAASLPASEPAAQSIELEDFAPQEAPFEQPASAERLSAPVEAKASVSHAAGPLSRAASAELEAKPEATPVGDALAAPVAAGSAEAGDAPPARKIDLGLDGHFFLHDPGPVAEAGPAPAAELGPRARKSTAQRQLEAALSADDVQRGLARGNALLGPLHSAVRDEGPLRGEATFRATVAADGSFGSVELLRGSAAEWSAVLSAFRQLAARKHVRLPPGAKGLRVTFSVKAKVQLPSGKAPTDTAVRMADPSLAPSGLIPQGDFDLADLGAGSQRLVYARVVSEEVL
jgi:hypothetical protein